MNPLLNQQKKVYTVIEITSEIKQTLEGNLKSILVKGEISNLKKHSSGHYYFTLKDNYAQISCVMWKWRNMHMSFILEDGMMVIEYSDKKPLRMEMRIANIGRIHYYLAPKVET